MGDFDCCKPDPDSIGCNICETPLPDGEPHLCEPLSNDAAPARELRECVICSERVPMSHATESWEKRHATLASAAHIKSASSRAGGAD